MSNNTFVLVTIIDDLKQDATMKEIEVDCQHFFFTDVLMEAQHICSEDLPSWRQKLSDFSIVRLVGDVLRANFIVAFNFQ